MSSISNLCVQIILSPQISKLTGIYNQPNISVICPSSTDARAVSQAQFGPGSGPTLYSKVLARYRVKVALRHTYVSVFM